MEPHWLLTALGAILAGAGLHFPVPSASGEHLKLLHWPMLAAARAGARAARIAVAFPAIVLQPVFLLALYYGLRALGVQGLAVDLTLYVLTMAGPSCLPRGSGAAGLRAG